MVGDGRGGAGDDRRMHATETSFGSQDGKQATVQWGRSSPASKQWGLISSGDKSPPSTGTSVPSHVFAKRSFPASEDFIPLQEGSSSDKSGVGKEGKGRRRRRAAVPENGRIWMSGGRERQTADASVYQCQEGEGTAAKRKAHFSLALPPLKFLTSFSLKEVLARQT